MSVSSDRRLARLTLCLLALLLGACQEGIMDDLRPSGADRRAQAQGNWLPGQPLDAALRQARLVSADGQDTRLEAILGDPQPPRAVVLYFTMWCPVCQAHSDHLLNQIVPAHPDLRYLLVDYVSGDWTDMRNAARANGYLGSALEPVLDADGTLFAGLHGAMGNVVVVDAQGVILMNAYYRDGQGLAQVLDGLSGP